MLEVYINHHKTALYTDTELCLSLRSALLDDETDDSSIPFTLPLKPNRSIFGNIDAVTHNNFPEYDASVLLSGIVVFSGKAVICSVTEDEVEVNLQSKSVYSVYENTYIDALNLGSYTPDNATSGWIHRLAKDTWDRPDSYPFVFAPVKDVYAEIFSIAINQVDMQTYAPAAYTSSWDPIHYHLSPCIYLRDAVLKVLAGVGYTVLIDSGESVMDWIDRVYILSYSFVHGSSGSNKNIYPNILSQQSSVSGLPYADMLPHITVKDFLNEMTRKFGLRFVFNDAKKEVRILRQSTVAGYGVMSLRGKVLDGMTKNTEENDTDVSRMYFYDKVIDLQSGDTGYEPNVSDISNMLQYGPADDNDKEVQCISHPCKLVDPEESDDLFMPRLDSTCFDKSEFILGVFYTTSVYDDGEHLLPDISNENQFFSLYWMPGNGLFNMLLSPYYTMLAGITQTHEVYLNPGTCRIDDAYNMFCRILVVKGQKYLVREQEISFTIRGLSEWKIVAVPI